MHLASGHSVSHGAASTEKIAGFELLPFLVDLFVGIGFLGIFLICFFFFHPKSSSRSYL